MDVWVGVFAVYVVQQNVKRSQNMFNTDLVLLMN